MQNNCRVVVLWLNTVNSRIRGSTPKAFHTTSRGFQPSVLYQSKFTNPEKGSTNTNLGKADEEC